MRPIKLPYRRLFFLFSLLLFSACGHHLVFRSQLCPPKPLYGFQQEETLPQSHLDEKKTPLSLQFSRLSFGFSHWSWGGQVNMCEVVYKEVKKASLPVNRPVRAVQPLTITTQYTFKDVMWSLVPFLGSRSVQIDGVIVQ